jgi:hypothetical protein
LQKVALKLVPLLLAWPAQERIQTLLVEFQVALALQLHCDELKLVPFELETLVQLIAQTLLATFHA